MSITKGVDTMTCGVWHIVSAVALFCLTVCRVGTEGHIDSHGVSIHAFWLTECACPSSKSSAGFVDF